MASPSSRPIFDAHHHLWSLATCHYPWLAARGQRRFFGDPTPIQRDYLVKDFRSDVAPLEIVGSVHVQVGVIESDAVRETTWLQGIRGSDGVLPSAIVGFADLRRRDLEQHLAHHQDSGAFRGVRQIIGRHTSEDFESESMTLLADPRFLQGLVTLERLALTFDLQLIERQYDAAISLFRRVPELKTALCHFGSPWDLSRDGFERWRRAMRDFSRLDNVSIKFSGFGMFKPDWKTGDMRPYVETSLDLFGPDRCMTGSNFPVDKLYGSYTRIWDAIDELIDDPSIKERVTVTNAARFYSVRLAEARSNSFLRD